MTQTPGKDRSAPVSLVRASAVMSLGTTLSRITGFLRLVAVAAALGVAESRLPDAYNLANTVPNVVYALVLGGIVSAVFLPIFLELLERESSEDAWRSISALLNYSMLGLVVVTVIGVVAAPWIASFYAMRLGEQSSSQREVIALLVQLLIPQIIFYGLYELLAALLQAHRRFGPPAYAPVLGNLLMIGVFVWFHQAFGAVDLGAGTLELTIIGLGTTAGIAVPALFEIPFLRRLGHYRLSLSLDRALLRKVARASLFVFGYAAASQLGYVFVQWLSNEQQGGFSAYIAAFTFYFLPITLFVASIGTALLPDLSGHALNERWVEFRERLSVAIRAINFLVLPVAIGYLVLGRPIVAVLLQHGVMTARSTDLVAAVLLSFVLGLPQGALFTLFIRIYYSLQDTKTPFFFVTAVVVFNAAINVPLFAWRGVAGLALGQALANTLGLTLAGRALSRRVGAMDGRRILSSASRALGASLVMGALTWIAWQLATSWLGTETMTTEMISLALSIIVGAGTYLLMAQVLRVEELGYVRRLIPRR